jgi:hypothetical protein
MARHMRGMQRAARRQLFAAEVAAAESTPAAPPAAAGQADAKGRMVRSTCSMHVHHVRQGFSLAGRSRRRRRRALCR